MKIILSRFVKLNDSICGRLQVVNSSNLVIFEAYSLELPYLNNVQDISSIPVGIYQIKYHSSAKFPKAIELLNVPNRSGILIHQGNKPKDTHGCILIGKELLLQYNSMTAFINDSNITLQKLLDKIQFPSTIEIINKF